MQKNIFLSMFIIAAVLAIALQGFSAETRAKTKGKTSTASTQETFNITGNISRINLKDSVLTISTKANTDLMFIVNKNTSISKAGKGLKITDIKNGDLIDVTYEKKGGKNIAKYIYVQNKYTTYPVKNKNR
ncbi:MAG: hypothetical protein ABIG92_02170 [Candidatus Omnitrophota bacterium]